jgi:hypothetical protein
MTTLLLLGVAVVREAAAALSLAAAGERPVCRRA